jgi:UDP-glucose 4-epimerase
MIQGDGLQVRDFVYVSDVVRAFDAAMRSATAQPRVFCICTGRSSSILELSRVLGELQGVPVGVEFAPPRTGDIRMSVGDPRRAREALGFTAAVALREGLAGTLAWMASAEPAGQAS